MGSLFFRKQTVDNVFFVGDGAIRGEAAILNILPKNEGGSGI